MSTPRKPGHCSYVITRIDGDVLPVAKAAALLSKTTIQEFISNAVNAAAAESLGRPAVQRLPAPPKPHGKGRPKKQ